MKYNPESRTSRVHLATILLQTLQEAGFAEESNTGSSTREKVFYRMVDSNPRLRIRVFTSIVGDEVRKNGKDAIRACIVYRRKDGEDHGVGSETRVNRTGDTEDICNRMLGRMRSAWVEAHKLKLCECGAPKYLSRNNNLVCAEWCWKK